MVAKTYSPLSLAKSIRGQWLTDDQFTSLFRFFFLNSSLGIQLGQLLDNPPQEGPKRDIMEEIEEQLMFLWLDDNWIKGFKVFLKDKTLAFKKEVLRILVEKKL